MNKYLNMNKDEMRTELDALMAQYEAVKARGLTIQIIEWYQSKWALFLRGFSRGQLNLFETTGPTRS